MNHTHLSVRDAVAAELADQTGVLASLALSLAETLDSGELKAPATVSRELRAVLDVIEARRTAETEVDDDGDDEDFLAEVRSIRPVS